MPAIISPKINLTYGYNDGEDGWGAAMNLNLLTMDSMIQGWVISRALATPPGAPNPGDMYVVAAAATGDWTGHTGDVAVWTLFGGGHWLFFTPHYNWRLWVDAEGLFIRYNGSSWVAETVGAVGGGIAGFSTVASMTLAFPAGTVGAVFNDPDPTNNFPRVAWLKSGASGAGAWTKGFDNLSAIILDTESLKVFARRVVVLADEMFFDRIDALGGGTNQIYVPRNIFIDSPGVVASNITIANPDSSEKPTFSKIAAPLGIRGLMYLDLTDLTVKVITATGGDFTMPSLTPSQSVILMTFSAGGAIMSPYRFRDLNPRAVAPVFMPVRPIVHSRADNKVYIPAGSFRSSQGIFSHTIASGDMYEEFSVSASATNVITYWYNRVANTYVATAAGAEPFTVDPSLGIVLGMSFNNEFWSPWWSVSVNSVGRGLNSFDKGKDPANAPKVQVAGTAHIVDITDSALIALGFLKGMKNSHPTTGSIPAYGDFLPDNRWPLKAFVRIYIQTDVPDDFGNARIWFTKEADTFAQNSFPLTLEKKLSTTAAIYSGSFTIPDPAAATNPNGLWSYWWAGTGNTGTPDRYAVTGIQADFGPEVRWIDRTDYPTRANLAKRVAALESSVLVSDPDIALLYGPDMWTITDEEQTLYPDSLTSVRMDQKRFETAFVSIAKTNVDIDETAAVVNMEAVDAYIRESVGAPIIIDPNKLGTTTYIMTRRYGDTGAAPDKRVSRRSIVVHRAPASRADTTSIHMTGDSLTSPLTIKFQFKARLRRYGIISNFIGTREYDPSKRVGNEGRGGWSFASAINAITPASSPAGLTSPLPVGNESIYLAGDDNTTKLAFNPYIRLAIGGDDPAKIFNGYIYDFAFYLNRWSSTVLGALPVPELVILNFGTGDINLYTEPDTSNWVTKGLDIMIDSMIAAGVSNIGIVFPTIPHSSRDGVWPEQASVIRTIIGWHKTKADPKVDLLPAWAHMSQNAGWPTNATDGSGTAIVDPVTGSTIETITDQTHYYDDLTRTQINKVHAAWVACKLAGV